MHLWLVHPKMLSDLAINMFFMLSGESEDQDKLNESDENEPEDNDTASNRDSLGDNPDEDVGVEADSPPGPDNPLRFVYQSHPPPFMAPDGDPL